MDLASSVGMHLKLIREAAGLTQEQLSQKSGVSQSQISMVEAGNSNTSIGTLNELAQALNVSISDVLSDYNINYENYYFENSEERKECAQYELENLKVLKEFYPAKEFNSKINTLMELFVYLPVIDPYRLFNVFSRVYGDFNEQEQYISSQLEWLVDTTPDSLAKEYADYAYEVLKKRKDERTPAINVTLKGHKAAHDAYIKLIERRIDYFRLYNHY